MIRVKKNGGTLFLLTIFKGFRMEIKNFPKLHEIGGNNIFFTQEQLKEIVNFAAERGIRVVPEIDMPGRNFQRIFCANDPRSRRQLVVRLPPT
jgi:hypothetical protein